MPTRKTTILIVDDTRLNVQIIKSDLEDEGYNILSSENGTDALRIAETENPDLILLDIMMPGMDGFEVCKILKEKDNTKDIPIIFLTARSEPKDVIKGFQLGAVDYLRKPFEVSELLVRVKTHVRLKHLQHNLEDMVEERARELVAAHEELNNMHDELTFVHTKLQEAYLEIIRRLARAADYRDNETGMHIIRMSNYSAILGKAAGMEHDEYRSLMHAATMHDVGKIGIPDSVLLKPGKLTSEEFDTMKAHSSLGSKLLSGIQSKLLRMAAKIAITHHEKWDGTGYPNGLAGEDIPLEGRIAGIVDVFDALVSSRPYKKPWSVDEAIELIKNEKGKHFDPRLVDLFIENLSEILEIKEKFADSQEGKAGITGE
jgi:putative two-component system response regulator